MQLFEVVMVLVVMVLVVMVTAVARRVLPNFKPSSTNSGQKWKTNSQLQQQRWQP